MKKKFKLIATISSLCLAVALMAFGVWAATSVEYTISNSVIYNIATEAKVTFTVDVYKQSTPAFTANGVFATLEGSDAWTKDAKSTSISTYSGENAAARYNADYTKSSELLYNLDGDGTGENAGSYVWKIHITISSIETSAQTVSIVNSISNANIWMVATDPSPISVTNVTPVEYTYYIGLKDATKPITENANIGNVVITVGTVVAP